MRCALQCATLHAQVLSELYAPCDGFDKPSVMQAVSFRIACDCSIMCSRAEGVWFLTKLLAFKLLSAVGLFESPHKCNVVVQRVEQEVIRMNEHAPACLLPSSLPCCGLHELVRCHAAIRLATSVPLSIMPATQHSLQSPVYCNCASCRLPEWQAPRGERAACRCHAEPQHAVTACPKRSTASVLSWLSNPTQLGSACFAGKAFTKAHGCMATFQACGDSIVHSACGRSFALGSCRCHQLVDRIWASPHQAT